MSAILYIISGFVQSMCESSTLPVNRQENRGQEL